MYALIVFWQAQGFILGSRLRAYLWYAFGAGLTVAGFAFAYSEDVFAFLIAPAEGKLSPYGGRLVYTGLTASFGASMSLAWKAGLWLGFFPVFSWGVIGLGKSYVPYKWWIYAAVFGTLSLLSFFAGLVFFYYVILGVMITFLTKWNSSVAVPLIEMNEYVAETTQLAIALGFIFVLPIAIYLLAKGNVVTYHQLKNKRLPLTLGLLTFAVFITPSLEGTLTYMVFTPMYVLFEVGVFAAWMVMPWQGNFITDFWVYKWLKFVVIWLVTRMPVLLYELLKELSWLLFVRLPARFLRWAGGQVARQWRRLVSRGRRR